MITRRIAINLVSFAVLSAVLVVYGFLDLLGNPLAATTTVSAVLPTASGVSPNFVVTLDGVGVGTVKSVSLAPEGAKITMTLDAGTHVPQDVTARVTVANALGQQQVDLVPDHAGPAPTIRAGAEIPANADSIPANVGTVVAEATKLLQSIPAGDLNTVIEQLAIALNGNGQNLRTIASASEQFSQEFLAYQQQFQSLLANAPPVLDVVTQNAPALQQGLAETAALVKVLSSKAPDLARLLNQGTSASSDLNALVTQNMANLGCLTHDLADINSNLSQSSNLSNLSTALATSHYLFDAVGGVAVEGPSKALTATDKARTDQEWLRTRLLLPPGMPMADSYNKATSLPAVLPGAACSTEFGQGVGAGLQANFKPAGPNSRVVAPTATQAHVRGGGPTTAGTAPAAARLSPSSPGAAVLPLMAGLFMMGWLLTSGRRRRTARSARAVPVEHELPTRRNR